MENHNYENEGQFQRKMTSRHLFMLSLGGVIGTGLFLSSGYTIAQAGPLGAILSYLVGAIVVYLVMLSLGELAVAMPVTGSFHTYATKFISPGTGFTVAWLYWICWTVALGTEFLGDILWGIKNLHGLDLEASEDVPISSFPRRRDYKAVTVTTDMPSLLQAAIDQNFVPVVDDRNVFIGMVRRTVILRDVYNKYGAKLDKPRQNTYTHA